MTRIFVSLAWIVIVLLVATLILGLSIGDLRGEDVETAEAARRSVTVHMLFGLAAALGVVLVQSIVVTYFIGTSRWCKEVSETYHLDPQFVLSSNQLKRRTFPWALMGMLVVVGVIALGAAADPATGRAHTEDWVMPHLLGALCGLAFILWAFVVEWQHIQANHAIILGVLDEVRRIRYRARTRSLTPQRQPSNSPVLQASAMPATSAIDSQNRSCR